MIERENLSMRMGVRRFTRKVNGFSKKLRNHEAAVSLYVAHYNFCRVHQTLRTTPAVASGVTERVWSIGELIDTALSIAPAEGRAAPRRANSSRPSRPELVPRRRIPILGT